MRNAGCACTSFLVGLVAILHLPFALPPLNAPSPALPPDPYFLSSAEASGAPLSPPADLRLYELEQNLKLRRELARPEPKASSPSPMVTHLAIEPTDRSGWTDSLTNKIIRGTTGRRDLEAVDGGIERLIHRRPRPLATSTCTATAS